MTLFDDGEPVDDLSELVSKAVGGDQAAWNEIVQRFGGRVWAICRAYRLSEADAADVFQQTWLRVLENLDSLRDPARLGAWIGTTCRHEALAVLRRAKRSQPVGDSWLLDRPTDPSDDPDAADPDRRPQHRAVAGVPAAEPALPGRAAGAGGGGRDRPAVVRAGRGGAGHPDRQPGSDPGPMPDSAALIPDRRYRRRRWRIMTVMDVPRNAISPGPRRHREPSERPRRAHNGAGRRSSAGPAGGDVPRRPIRLRQR